MDPHGGEITHQQSPQTVINEVERYLLDWLAVWSVPGKRASEVSIMTLWPRGLPKRASHRFIGLLLNTLKTVLNGDTSCKGKGELVAVLLVRLAPFSHGRTWGLTASTVDGR